MSTSESITRTHNQSLPADFSQWESSPQVAQAQTQLVELGYPVRADGAYNDSTRRALAAFQTRERLPVRDGSLDGDTMAALHNEVSGQHAEQEQNPNHAQLSMGYSAVATHDSFQRVRYMNDIKQMSEDAVATIDAVGEGNPRLVEHVTREASELRNTMRTQAQQRLSPGGRVMSELIEEKKTFAERVAKKAANPKHTSAHEVLKAVTEGAGNSNRHVLRAAKVMRVAGPLGMAVGAYSDIQEIAEAPPQRRVRMTTRVVGRMAAGAVAGTAGIAIGSSIMSAGVGALAASGPPGWAILAAGALGGAVLGYFGSKAGDAAAGAAYDAVTE